MKKTFKTFVLMLLTAFAFSGCVDVPAPYNLPDKSSNSGGGSSSGSIEPAGEGTLASPYNVAAIVAKIREMEAGVESTEEYYIKGKVLAVKTDAATISQYGNHTFTMVDEGSNSPVFTAFQVYGPGKKRFTSVDDVKVGDEVVVCGKVVNYRGNTPETVGKGAAYVVSINAGGGGGGEQGNVQHISIAEFLQKADPNTTYELTGTVKNITSTLYGNFDLVEGDASIYIYGLLDLNGEAKKFESLGIEEGDVVTLTGKYLLYNNKPEISNAQFVSVVKGDDGGGDQGDVQHISIAEFLQKADPNTTFELTGTVKNITNTLYGNFDLVEGDASIYIYGLLDLNGEAKKFESLGIEEGDVVTLTGKYLLYNNKPEISNAQFVSVVKGDDGGGDQGDVQHITIAEFLQKADVNTTYELTGTVRNIVNTTYGNFDLVEGDASIYIYGLLDLNGEAKKFESLGIEEGDVVTLTGKYLLYNNKPEISNAQFISLVKGEGGDDGGDPTPGPGGDPVTDLVNGDFESWVSDAEPTGWKSASTAGNATLSKSTDARNGSYACAIAAPGTQQNKRLATQEMTLEAGSYTFSFYAKSTTANNCQARAGYVPIKPDGAVDTYKWSNHIDINNGDWTLVSYDFELTSTTKLCLLVMNPKGNDSSTSQDILVDDATLVKK